MKITQNVNIGGYPFIIDQDAFIILQKYLDTLETHFSKSEGCEEIVYDIEVRFAELLMKRVQSKAIVSISDVNQIIDVLGRPEQLDDQPSEDSFSIDHNQYTPVKRRLYRDPEDKVIGGVCSGLAAYFGMDDPIWLRIALAFLLFFGGTGAMAYFILWWLVPEAKTPMDRLAMHGKPINIQNIANQVEERVEQIAHHIEELGHKFSSK